MVWGNYNNPNSNRYEFAYDNLSRLTLAMHNSYINNSSAEYSYDKHGNIQYLARLKDYEQLMDDLYIAYSGNQMVYATDISYDPDGFSEFSESGTEYTYNKNGSMAWDANMGVHNSFDIYNGMPATTSVNNPTAKGWIQYRYTVTGQKLSAAYWHDPSLASQPISGSAFTQADIDANNRSFNKEIFYMGNMILENYGKKKLLLDNGYYDFDQNKYYFYVKDHLGNNRVVAREDGTVVQQTDYYPFGMPTVASTGEGVQPYKFGGKEYDTNSGLDLYDFHARQYDPATIRFTSVDPLAEKYYSISPYAYVANNPINAIDINGDSITITYRTGFLGLGGKKTHTYDNGNLYNKDGSAYTGKVKGFLKDAVNGLGDLKNTSEGNSLVLELQNSDNVFDIQKGSKNEFEDNNRSKAVGNLVAPGSSTGSGGIIRWNPKSTSGGLDTKGNTSRPSYIGLGHELAHGSDANRGVLDFRQREGIAVAEWNAIYRENIIRGQAGVAARQYYGIDMSTEIPVGTGPNLFRYYLNKQLMKSIMSINP